MRVLLLVHRIPYPPDKGDKIRSFRVLEALTAAHEVDLVAHVDDPADARHQAELERRCASVSLFPIRPAAARTRALGALATGGPLSVAWFRDPAAGRAVERLAASRGYGAIVVFSSQPARHVPVPAPAPVVVDFVDVDSEKWLSYGRSRRGPASWIHRIEGGRLRRYERALARGAAASVVSTEREAALFRDVVADVPVDVVPNGVSIPDRAAPASEREPGLMVFVGAMDYPANVEAVVIGAREILPEVRRAVPNARFRIVGRKPTAVVRALAGLPGVEVAGEVADVRPHVRAADLCLVPLRTARGIQNKVLEAMAEGTPVVCSDETAASFGADADGVCVRGAGAAELASGATRLLRDRARAAEVGLAGRAYVSARHRWDAFGERFREIVARAASGGPAATARRGAAAAAAKGG